ncbi:type II secretion system protein GspD [Leptotrichia sp. oral taxon 847]|uniref:type II secretion system protein GspD n=1 Tax=Leptotrichia sp. oral taxon 847 TaxID=1785996 RepID=UPI0007681CD9|nr:general secretion pathway protein GspD [Leptotrichia sp. oral taxon 847]AMD95412.1 general secretion pathway protein GspD [Leptotrichia sp. oral taxon 847]
MRKSSLILYAIIFFSNTFSAKVTDYVNKNDAQNLKKIFIYKVPKENKKIENNNVNNKNNNAQQKQVKTSESKTLKDTKQVPKVENQNKEVPKIESPKKEEIKNKTGEIEFEYRDVKEISEALNGFEKFEVIGVGNKIIFSGDEKKFEEIKKIIKSFDSPKEQVIIKGTIIDTSSNLFERLGIDWSINSNSGNTGKNNLVAKFLNGEISISSIFSAGGKFLGVDFNMLKENGDIKIEAMPTLMIMEKEEGELKVTEEVIVGEKKITKNNEDYIEPIFSEAGIVFKITPEIKKINGVKKILLKLDTEISNFKLTSSYSASSGAKQKNQTRTTITLNDGGSTFIGGLKQNVSKETQRRIPILSKIPIIGPLFKYRRTNKEVRDIYIEIEAVIQNDKSLLIN